MTSRSPRARPLLIVTFTSLVILYTWFALNRAQHRSGERIAPSFGDGILNPELSDQNGIPAELSLSNSFKYIRYCVGATQKADRKRQSLVRIQQKLSPTDFDVIPSNNSTLPPCRSTFAVEVPPFKRHDWSGSEKLLLGVATTLDRINSSLDEQSHWLSHADTCLLVLLVDQLDVNPEDENVKAVHAKAKALGISIILNPFRDPNASEGVKNFGLAEPLWRESQNRPEVEWVGIIDDDTFFVSLATMVDTLETFNPMEPLYLGQLTEGFTRLSNEGFKGWGGAGFFLSLPLLKLLAENAEDCRALDTGFGDILWRDCIYRVTSPTVQLTQVPGLNQMDLWKDLSGWYEAGQNPLLTIHHWKSWHSHPIPVAHIVSDVAGPEAFLQRYLFAEDNVVFTNGYSFVQYPKGIPDLNQVELTMTEDAEIHRPPGWKEFHQSMGRTRPALTLGDEKISWRFAHATKTDDGIVRQFYVLKASQSGEDDSLVEIDWS